MHYNKLVRDHIPEIIKQSGDTPVIHIATDAEYIDALKKKLYEEVDEFLTDLSAQECADVLEVLYAICEHEKIDIATLEKVRVQKYTARGGFHKRIILEKTEEK